MSDPSSNDEIAREVGKRRTFAIISHPDAGKTTLTEKLLLFGGAIQMAGSVKSRKAARHATSDWMAMEKERGISIDLGFAPLRLPVTPPPDYAWQPEQDLQLFVEYDFMPPGIMAQFIIQAKAVGIAATWSVVAAFISFKIADVLVGLRVPEDEEREHQQHAGL